ncbi:MAG: hypothetical protein A3J83_01380 [Elusimicrobia bacterium RIFOXYA2_FULL_40_6]|nr:MAG: hypothetical protein A3J83_01380 [Elusimicrobia bacterium RIFOXYA2_FULL_40_6]
MLSEAKVIYPEKINALNPLAEYHHPKYEEMMLNYYKFHARFAPALNRNFKNLNEWKQHREYVLKNLKAGLGSFPEKKCPLNTKITGTLQKNGYKIEKIIFQSRPDFWVCANVYIPTKNSGTPKPAVVCVHGHSQPGKAVPYLQRVAIGLAKRGYIALTMDVIGFGERASMGHDPEALLLPVVGESLEGYEVWDVTRGIDYLYTRKDVNKNKIGCTGVSGGGNLTMYSAVMDERITAAVSVGSVCMLQDMYFKNSYCICECVPNLSRYTDISELCSVIAPRAFMILHGDRDDCFPVAGTRQAYKKAKQVYDLYKSGNKVNFVEGHLHHCYATEQRFQMYAWFDNWLKGIETKVSDITEEDPIIIESPEGGALNCLKDEQERQKYFSGALAKIFKQQAREKINKIPELSNLAQYKKFKNRVVPKLEREIFGGFPREKTPLNPICTGVIEKTGQVVEKIIFNSEPGIVIPSLLIKSKTGSSKEIIIYVPDKDNGKVGERDKNRALNMAHIQKFVQAGTPVFALDLRASGETCYDYPEEEASDVRHSIIFGRHMIGMRVWDVIRAVDYIESRKDLQKYKITLYGEGVGALLCILAGIYDSRIQKCICDRLPLTFNNTDLKVMPYSFYIPNILNYVDVPQIAGLFAPRELVVLNSSKNEFAWAKTAYKITGKEKNLKLF